MKTAIIGVGGLGDILRVAQAATLIGGATIYVNSHKEVYDFCDKSLFFPAKECPKRNAFFKESEHPLNLPKEFIDELFSSYSNVYFAAPDDLGTASLSFPWFKYVDSYKDYVRIKVPIRVHPVINPIPKVRKRIFIHATTVTMEKNYSLTYLQALVDLLNKTPYEIVIARTSKWKGTELPFYLEGKYIELVDRPIEECIYYLNSSDYFFGVDSSFSHVAYHLNLPRLIVLNNYHNPIHICRWQEDISDTLPLDAQPEMVFNRIMLGMKDPITQTLPTFFNIPHTVNTKQLLYKKYYD